MPTLRMSGHVTDYNAGAYNFKNNLVSSTVPVDLQVGGGKAGGSLDSGVFTESLRIRPMTSNGHRGMVWTFPRRRVDSRLRELAM